MADSGIRRPSPDLLDTIYLCQQRQEWFRDFAQANGEERPAFVGSMNVSGNAATAGATIRDVLSFEISNRGATWSEALRRLMDAAETVGLLVMVSGVVGSNTHRRLDVHEFRGFALVDPLAPLIFINGADTKAAQIFTLAHELAHIWLGETALSDANLRSAQGNAVERWCNQVAAELLVPLEGLRHEFNRDEPLAYQVKRLAGHFKVSIGHTPSDSRRWISLVG